MSACGSKRKESRPSPSLSLSPPSLGPLLLSRSLLPLSALSFSLALSSLSRPSLSLSPSPSLSLAAREWERCALRCAGERERETRFAARDWWRGALRCGEGRFAARERDRESCAAPRSRPTPISFSFNPNPALRRVLLSFNDVLVRRARNPNHGQEAGCAYLAHSCACVCVLRVCLRICADVCVCVCVCVLRVCLRICADVCVCACLCFACVPADLR